MSKTKTWEQYEAGRAYKRRLGLDETVWKNERYYRGEQWGEGDRGKSLPHPVFNVVRRVVDYLVGAVAGGTVSVVYTDDGLTDHPDEKNVRAMQNSLNLLNGHVSYRWEHCRMDRKIYQLLLDAALSGDGVLYSYWDTGSAGCGYFGGDIRTVLWNNTELYAADMNRADIQSQEYLILSGRESVTSLRREAIAAGLDEREIEKIRPDEVSPIDGRRKVAELPGEEEAKATVLLKFWKEDGFVWFEKSTAEVVLRRVQTGLRLYPIAYFNWIPTRGSFHGTAPVTGMIANQNFINRAYAMVMKHMTDTAFSKVVYDKSRIPEWSNEVGEAIAAHGGNLSDAVSVVGTGTMQDGYMELIENAIETTKELMGATDTALGSAQASNTSAILALQEASRMSLQQVCAAFCQCVEDLACIWADMLCAYHDAARPLPFVEGGERQFGYLDPEVLRKGILRARVEVGSATQYSASGAQSLLEKLLDGGYISLRQYLELLPVGILPMRERLIRELEERGGATDGRNGNGGSETV